MAANGPPPGEQQTRSAGSSAGTRQVRHGRERVRDLAHRCHAGVGEVVHHVVEHVSWLGRLGAGRDEEVHPGREPLAALDPSLEVRQLEVRVGVHERGQEDGIEVFGGAEAGFHLLARPDTHDDLAVERDRAVRDDGPVSLG